MVTISLQLSNELARRVLPIQHRLPEIIELGLHQMAMEEDTNEILLSTKQEILEALASTGIVTLPTLAASGRLSRHRRTPIRAGGPPASEMIIADRR